MDNLPDTRPGRLANLYKEIQKVLEEIEQAIRSKTLAHQREPVLSPVLKAAQNLALARKIASDDISVSESRSLTVAMRRLEGLKNWAGESELAPQRIGPGWEASDINPPVITTEEAIRIQKALAVISSALGGFLRGEPVVFVPEMIFNDGNPQSSNGESTTPYPHGSKASEPQVAVGSFDETALIWNLPNGEKIQVGRRPKERKPKVLSAWLKACNGELVSFSDRDPNQAKRSLKELFDLAKEKWGGFICPPGKYPVETTSRGFNGLVFNGAEPNGNQEGTTK